jgi:hypothetical protein
MTEQEFLSRWGAECREWDAVCRELVDDGGTPTAFDVTSELNRRMRARGAEPMSRAEIAAFVSAGVLTLAEP